MEKRIVLASPALRWLAHDLREIAAAEPKMSPQKALKVLLKDPNWEEKVKEYFKNEKTAAGLTKAVPLALAIFTLAQQAGADTAPELIKEIKQKAQQEQVQDIKITQADINRMKEIIPFPISDAELGALKTGAIPFFMFKGTFGRKIKKALDDEVLPAVEKDPRFSQLSADALTDLVLKGFMAKINDPKYKDASDALEKYLKGDMGKIETLAKNVLQKEIRAALR